MKLKVFSNEGGESGESEFDIPVFEDSKGVQAVKEVIVAQAANGRQGSANTKTRGEVRGGGKKPWRQKGTGRARAGSNTSPIWVRGGKAHGTNPRDYRQDITKKMLRGALLSAYSVRASEENISVLDFCALLLDICNTKKASSKKSSFLND